MLKAATVQTFYVHDTTVRCISRKCFFPPAAKSWRWAW